MKLDKIYIIDLCNAGTCPSYILMKRSKQPMLLCKQGKNNTHYIELCDPFMTEDNTFNSGSKCY